MAASSLLRWPRRSRESGSVAILIGLTLIIIIGLGALVVDFGNLFRVRNQLQNASDSASLAAAQELDGTAAGIDRARVKAKEYGLRHDATGDAIEIDDADIVFGMWDETNRTFTDLGNNPGDPADVNAVRVVDRRDATQGNPVDLHMAPVIGHNESDVSTLATAVGGGPAAECGFPLVVPDCSLNEAISDGTCDFCLIMQNNNDDNAGWTSFAENGGLGNKEINSRVLEACFDGDGNPTVDPVTNRCLGTCSNSFVGAQVQVKNGNMMNKNNFCATIEDILYRGDESNTPKSFVVSVPVLKSDDGTCSAEQFSSQHKIAGYATLEIHGIQCGNNQPMVIDPTSPAGCQPSPSGDAIVASLRCDGEPSGVAGGGFFGLDAKHVRLVE